MVVPYDLRQLPRFPLQHHVRLVVRDNHLLPTFFNSFSENPTQRSSKQNVKRLSVPVNPRADPDGYPPLVLRGDGIDGGLDGGEVASFTGLVDIEGAGGTYLAAESLGADPACVDDLGA